jgi:DNA topoisomerase-1
MKLIIAEKPKVAQKIAEAIADKSVQRKKGKGQAYYFEVEKNGEKIVVSPAVGHLYTLEEKSKTNSYPAFDMGSCIRFFKRS